MKVLSVVGARPQFVKAAAVSPVLREEHEEVLVHTGQHYDDELSAVFFDALDIPEPDHHLDVGSDSHAGQTGEMMRRLGPVVAEESPDAVVVYGDTNSTLAGALVAAKREQTLAHVEAGLRSYDRSMPEEVNRVLADHAADLLFVPSERAVDALAAEGVEVGVHDVGDVMYDVILAMGDRIGERSTVRERLGLDGESYVLATVHRASNTDDPARLESIVAGLAEAPGQVVLPVHPRTEAALRDHDLWEWATEQLRIVDALDYVDFVALLEAADRVATDSGGVQKEAFYLDTPCVVLREETEWPEIVDAGWATLAGADPTAIAGSLADPFPTDRDPKPTPYGDGRAAERICEVLSRRA